MDNEGSKVWFIPDGYLPSVSNGSNVSHEAVCVLNLTKHDAEIEITLYFEDQDKKDGFFSTCKSERTNHIRLDKIKDREGKGIPRDTPYSMAVRSSVNIIAQYSRMDTSQAELALMTTMAFPG